MEKLLPNDSRRLALEVISIPFAQTQSQPYRQSNRQCHQTKGHPAKPMPPTPSRKPPAALAIFLIHDWLAGFSDMIGTGSSRWWNYPRCIRCPTINRRPSIRLLVWRHGRGILVLDDHGHWLDDERGPIVPHWTPGRHDCPASFVLPSRVGGGEEGAAAPAARNSSLGDRG